MMKFVGWLVVVAGVVVGDMNMKFFKNAECTGTAAHEQSLKTDGTCYDNKDPHGHDHYVTAKCDATTSTLFVYEDAKCTKPTHNHSVPTGKCAANPHRKNSSSIFTCPAHKKTSWYSAYGLTKQEIAKWTDLGCYRGLFGGDQHDQSTSMSLLTCPPAAGAESFAELASNAFLCVVELRDPSNFAAAEAIVSENSHLASVVHKGTHDLVLRNSDDEQIGELSELCSDAHFSELADNVIYVATEAIIPQAPMPKDHPAVKRAFGADAANLNSDPIIEHLIAAFSETGVSDYVKWLATDNEGSSSRCTRNSYATGPANSGNGGCRTGWFCANNAVDDVVKEVNALLVSYPHEWSVEAVPFRDDMCHNVRLIIPGAVHDASEGIVVIGAHLDSRNTGSGSSATGQAPGADDNGSGSAVNLEIIKAMAANPHIEYSYGIHILWFCGEEQGLLGSQNLARAYAAAGQPIIGMFNNDMIGYTSPSQGVTLSFMGRYATEWLSSSCKAFVSTYLPNLKSATTNVCCSDQQSFFNSGFPSAGIFETPQGSVQYPQYHRTGDTWDNGLINYNQIYQFGQANFVCILEYAIPIEG